MNVKVKESALKRASSVPKVVGRVLLEFSNTGENGIWTQNQKPGCR